MKKVIIVIRMILVFCLLAACGHEEKASKDDSGNKKQEDKQSTKESAKGVPDDIFYEAAYVDGIVRDTGRFIVKEFGYRSNIHKDIKDGMYTVGLEEVDGSLTRFYNGTGAIRYKDDAYGRSVELNLIGELGKDYDDTYVSAMKRTKKLLDYLFTYDTVDVNQVTLSWYYPYKHSAGEKDYTLYPIYKLTIERDEYNQSWKKLNVEQMTLDTITHGEHMIVPSGALLMPFTENRKRHDKVGKEYDMNGLKVTLLGANFVSSLNGESAKDYCGEDRDCKKFIQVKMKVKNDRNYSMILDAGTYINVAFHKKEKEEESGLETIYPYKVKGAVTYKMLQPGEEVVLSPYYPWQENVEHTGISFTTGYAKYPDGFDTEKLATIDQSYIHSWLVEDVVNE